jgi:hypothetical protein
MSEPFSGSRWPSPVSQSASIHSDDPIASVQSFHDSLPKEGKSGHSNLTLGTSVQAKDRPFLSPSSAPQGLQHKLEITLSDARQLQKKMSDRLEDL